MKRLGSSDSLSGLIPICPTEEDDFVVESGHVAEKKRRLSVDQVKALEKNFEVENKLEPERKVKLAQELGLQPRQVAVWFQNRRARWKTKQLERDYGVLEANYKTLKLNFESLQQDKESLLAELREVKSKLQEETKEKSGVSIKEESEVIPKCESEYIVSEQSKISSSITEPTIQGGINGASVFGDFKDGFSDSDSSAILNEEINTPTTTNNSSPSAAISSSTASRCSSSINCFTFSDSTQKGFHHPHHHHHQQPFVRMEEHNFFSVEETCNFFSDDQAPSLQWCYSADQWN